MLNTSGSAWRSRSDGSGAGASTGGGGGGNATGRRSGEIMGITEEEEEEEEVEEVESFSPELGEGEFVDEAPAPPVKSVK
jgi:hypothetical protein